TMPASMPERAWGWRSARKSSRGLAAICGSNPRPSGVRSFSSASNEFRRIFRMTDSVTGSATDSMPRVLGRPAELMLVEDNYGDILLTQEAFKICKIANRLQIARDGEEALKMLRKEAP